MKPTILAVTLALCTAAAAQEPDYHAIAESLVQQFNAQVQKTESRLRVCIANGDRGGRKQCENELVALRRRAFHGDIYRLPELTWADLALGAVGRPVVSDNGITTPVTARVIQADFSADEVLLALDWAPEYRSAPAEVERTVLVLARDPKWPELERHGFRFPMPTIWIRDTVEYPSDGGIRVVFRASLLPSDQAERIKATTNAQQPASRALRTWSDPTATHTIEAQLDGLSGRSVILKRPNGTRIEVPLHKLSSADRSFVGQTLGSELEPELPSAPN